jgi:hypothetical protein
MSDSPCKAKAQNKAAARFEQYLKELIESPNEVTLTK